MADKTENFPNIVSIIDAPVAVSATQSGDINLRGQVLTAVLIPASTEGATMTFEEVIDGVYYPIKDDGGDAYTVTFSGLGRSSVDQTKFYGVQALRLTINTAQTGAGAAIKLVTIPA
jgi:hypothetical protein